MCGIIGLFTKNAALESDLGRLASGMLLQLSDRGPDSAGFAVYRDRAPGIQKITVMLPGGEFPVDQLERDMKAAFGGESTVTRLSSHAVLRVPEHADGVRDWLREHFPALYITSAGSAIEIFKEIGRPDQVASRFEMASMRGSHALGHTRMATESAVTTRASHPFSTGRDVCLVHNGSLSNHNRLRERLKDEGIAFGTDNDSEVAAGYLQWRTAQGDDLDAALNRALEDLDGFYTFAIGTADGFAVLRDPVGCKPAVMAETDDWVAMASEFRAIATLPGVDDARIEEPEPGRVYTWHREDSHA